MPKNVPCDTKLNYFCVTIQGTLLCIKHTLYFAVYMHAYKLSPNFSTL